INDSLRHAGANGRVLPALDRNDAAGVDPVRGVLARAFAAGAPIDEALALPERGSFVPLPSYPWQRKTYRVDPTQEAWNLSGGEGDQPLLGYHPRPELPVWTVHLDHELLPYLADHCVEDAVVFPAAGFVEMALAAGEQWLGTGDLEIQDMEIVRPLVFD